jgi:hypothetical protein
MATDSADNRAKAGNARAVFATVAAMHTHRENKLQLDACEGNALPDRWQCGTHNPGRQRERRRRCRGCAAQAFKNRCVASIRVCALRNLTYDTIGTGNAGAVEAVVQAMRRHSSDHVLQTQACGCAPEPYKKSRGEQDLWR